MLGEICGAASGASPRLICSFSVLASLSERKRGRLSMLVSSCCFVSLTICRCGTAGGSVLLRCGSKLMPTMMGVSSWLVLGASGAWLSETIRIMWTRIDIITPRVM